MVDPISLPLSAGELAQRVSGRVVGNENALASRLASLENAGDGALCYYADPKYGSFLKNAEGAVVLTRGELYEPALPITYVIVDSPQRTFASIARGSAGRHFPSEWDGKSFVHPSACVGSQVSIGAHAYIGPDVKIGQGTRIFPFAYVGSGVEIGENCEIHPHVVIWDGSQIGNRVRIFASSVIGSDGFGILGAEQGESTGEMPQVGRVVIEDDVRIGAHCAVDRATLDETRIGRGCKIDNQVHIAHNVKLGKNILICAQSGIAGSTTIGDGVILAGKAGIGHGVTIGAGARVGGGSIATTNLKEGETYYLTPAMPIREGLRIVRYWKKLPELWERVKKLEAALGK